MRDENVLAWGSLYCADFRDKTLSIRVEGDMPSISRGRYAIIEAERLRMLVMQANLWRDSKKEKAS